MKLSAQVYCFDSTVVNQSVTCPSTYEPYCGCDGITYRNYCEMYYHHGIVYYESGICEPMAIEFNPNPVKESIHMTLMLKDEGDAFIYIFDLYGKSWYFRRFNKIEKLIFDIELNKLPAGLYFIHGQTNDFSVIRKFIKVPNR
jgi:hypothetical protein